MSERNRLEKTNKELKGGLSGLTSKDFEFFNPVSDLFGFS